MIITHRHCPTKTGPLFHKILHRVGHDDCSDQIQKTIILRQKIYVYVVLYLQDKKST